LNGAQKLPFWEENVNKTLRIFMAVVLSLSLASPAVAKITLDGFYRLSAISQTHLSGTSAYGYKSNDVKSQNFIDQRLRLRLTNNVNEWVSVVYYAEIDTPFGEPSRGSIGAGGRIGGDGVNVETKNVYLNVLVPDTTVSVRAGLQWWTDSYDNIIAAQDMSAIVVKGKINDATDYQLMYSKWQDGDDFTFAGESDRNKWNDTDFYVAELKYKVSDYVKVGTSVYYLDDNTDTEFGTNPLDFDTRELFYYGASAEYRYCNFGVRGWVLVQDGEFENDTTGESADSTVIAANIKAKLEVDPGDIGLRLIYVSDNDDEDDASGFVGGQGTTEFNSDNLMIFLEDPYTTSSGTSRFAMADASDKGFGLFAVTATGNFTKGLPYGIYSKFGLGAFWSTSDDAGDDGIDKREGKFLGYEAAGRVGKVFIDKVDISLRAAYAVFGDFYDNTVEDGDDPDDVYKVTLMVNVPF
jgi:hypothetical protein